MNTAIITRHAVTNYGSLLQTMATQEVICQLGHEAVVIDYIRDDEKYQNIEKTMLSKKNEWNSNPLKKAIYLMLRQPGSIIAGKKFENYRNKCLNLTKRYSSKEELINDKLSFDCYITGSDQVWGPVGNGEYDDCYCLSFTKEEDKKIAYAASFGRNDFDKKTEEYFVKWLSRYDKILVRESSALQKLSEWALPAEQVLDPTLLLSKEYWMKFVNKTNIDKYLLIYQLHNNKRLDIYAKELAKRKGLKIVRVSQFLHQIINGGKFVWCPSPSAFLSLIAYSECLITDSFHGTAFAINFNKPFIEVLPNNKTETRNVSILKLTGLTERILMKNDDYSIFDKKIDFNKVNSIIEQERNRSIKILKETLDYLD